MLFRLYSQIKPCLLFTKYLKYRFSSQPIINSKIHRFTYGQAGQFQFDLRNRTYSFSFETIWEDYAELEYSGLTGQKKFFITQKGKNVNMDDQDFQLKQTQYIKIHAKIPEDYTLKGRINGSIRHLKNSVSSKNRCNPFEIEILGYKNTYQWLDIESQNAKIFNKNGEVSIGSLTAKDILIYCEAFKAKKILYSGQIAIKATQKMQVRSIVAYKNALAKIENSGDVYIESLSGKIFVKECKSLKIDRLLSCKEGIEIQCGKINDHIVIESGSGTIQCDKESREILKQKIKLGRMHKGRIDFDVNQNVQSAYSKVVVVQ